MLGLTDINARKRERTLLHIPSLRVENPGLLWLVGPGGAGKSSLLLALAGQPLGEDCQLSGRIVLDDQARLDERDISLVRQHAQIEGSHFRAVMDGLEREARLYLLDEPTADEDETHCALIRARIAERARDAMVVAVTHNRQDCLATGGTTALLASGSLQEVAPTERFFASPRTVAGRAYVDTGNCSVPAIPSPSAQADGIWWLVPQLLGGMSRPGLVHDAEAQYDALARNGVSQLVCLEEQCVYPVEPLRERGIARSHFPVPDMAPPSFSQAVDICRQTEEPIRNNQAVIAHCRGGLGRTGTVLAAILIWFGDAAKDAIEKVRVAQPHAIQSAAQLRFLDDFAHRIRGWH